MSHPQLSVVLPAYNERENITDAVDRAVEALEGDWRPDRLVLLKFPTVERARAFYASSEYSRARQARHGAAIMRMVLLEGQ